LDNFVIFVIARALHVVGVVWWIGGVSFVTIVLMPGLSKIADEKVRLQLFEQLEGRFSFQAKIATTITALSGFYMVEFMNAWERYLYLQFWWLHLMTFVWFLFAIVLFVLEPLFLHKWFREQAEKDTKKTFIVMKRLHYLLLSVSVLAVFCAVAGAHGLFY